MRPAGEGAAMEEHAGRDDRDDLPGQPKPGRNLAPEQFEGCTGNDNGRGEADHTGGEGACSAAGEENKDKEQRQQGEQGRHVWACMGRLV